MIKNINLQSVKNFVKKHFNINFGFEEELFKEFLNDYNSCLNLNESEIKSPNDSTIVYFLYRLFNRIKLVTDVDINFYNKTISKYSSYIGPDAKIGKNFNIFLSKNIYIENGVIIGDNVKLANNIKIGNSKTKPRLCNNIIVDDNVNIFGNIVIGDNAEINHGCYISDDIAKSETVSIINQLQLVTKSTKNYLPSQTLIIYGVIPKYKNTIQIVGNGFYNPIVSFKNCPKDLDFSITYWDKNKIIIKIKNTKPIKCENVIVSVLCNHVKVNILNSVGISQALSNLQP